MQRDMGSMLGIPRAITHRAKEVNKWVSGRGLGLLDPRAQGFSGPELKGLTQTPQQDGQAQQEVKEEEEVFVH